VIGLVCGRVRLDAETVERLAEVVGEGKLHHRLAIRPDGHALHRDVKPGPDVGELLGGQVMFRLRRRVHLRRADGVQPARRHVSHVRGHEQIARCQERHATVE
jgi:hypothetical protein